MGREQRPRASTLDDISGTDGLRFRSGHAHHGRRPRTELLAPVDTPAGLHEALCGDPSEESPPRPPSRVPLRGSERAFTMTVAPLPTREDRARP